jgi:hypothetical protein
MSSVESKTIVDFIPCGLSQQTANWYAENDPSCPQWVKFGVTILSNCLSIGLTPLAILCDLAASLIFKLWAFCSSDSAQLHTKSWEYFKSAFIGGPLVIALDFIRFINPGYSANIQEQAGQVPPQVEPAVPSPQRIPSSPRPPAPSVQPPAQPPPAQASDSPPSDPLLSNPQLPIVPSETEIASG